MPDPRPWTGRRLHLVGIGGAGMSGYATVAAQLGATVTGSDRAASPALERLVAAGIDARAGHDAAQLPEGSDVEVVVSSAIGAGNPEIVAARERGLRVMPRAELLGELSALRRTIAVAGAHGKTTTSSMTAHVLLACDMDPGYLIGGELRTTGRNAAWGTGDWLVVEADESDRSMLSLNVEVAVVTNVELDHHATYGSLAEVREVFRTFLAAPPHAVILDRPDLLALRPAGDTVAYEAHDLRLDAAGSRMTWRGHDVELTVPGEHNARNAVAALEAVRLAGAPEEQAARAIATFSGAGRRFERLGQTASGALVIDDYAHHPTEVAATLAAARTLAPRRLVAVFQPHLFSRTQHLAGAFGRALAGADVVGVVDVYPARERAQDFPGVSGLTIAEATVDAGGGAEVLWLPAFDDAERVLSARLVAGDVCMVLGAGDVRALGERLVAQ
jgi:UDP-N-acetylmuramate--alanine ligase